MVCIAAVVVLGSECKTDGVSLPASLADERPDELLLLPAVGSSVGDPSRGKADRGSGKADRGPGKADRSSGKADKGCGKADRGSGKADTALLPLQCDKTDK